MLDLDITLELGDNAADNTTDNTADNTAGTDTAAAALEGLGATQRLLESVPLRENPDTPRAGPILTKKQWVAVRQTRSRSAKNITNNSH